MGRARNTEMPNLFVIGAEKCGTTSLHSYLDLHPEISMSRQKEAGYFARSSADDRLVRVADRNDYLGLFQPGTQVRGDTTPAYSSFPESSGTPARIDIEVSEPKFIYLVRDPSERIESALRHWAAYGRFGPGSEALVVEELPRNFMLSRSRYMTQIEQYLEYFPPESILVVDSDRLRHERSTTLAEIFEFLGVEPTFDHPDFREEKNPATSYRVPPGIWRRLRSARLADFLVRVTPGPMRLRVRKVRWNLSQAVGEPLPEIVLSDALRERLRTELEPEIAALREFTGQKFDGWSM
jgi:hypothetical protein